MTILPRPPYDAELAPIQDAMEPFPITHEIIIAAHKDPSFYGPLPGVAELIGDRPITHTEHHAPALQPDDPSVTLSVFTPVSKEDPPPLRPCVYFMHGGGMIFLHRFVGLEQPIDWVMATGCVLVSVEYRLAPENPQPALSDDCYAGLCWVHSNATLLGVDTKRIMVAGHSGGSGLAAAIALMARDKGGPPICAQLLACPMLDDRNDSTSCMQYDDEEPWARVSNAIAWGAVLGDRAGRDDVSEYFAPARAKNLEGLPPAWVDVGSAEVMRDEAVTYASKLWAAGVQAELHVWPGGFHGFDMMAPTSQLAQRATAAKNEWVKRMLA